MTGAAASRTLPIDGGHLAYVDRGAGRPVVLLHGGGLDHRAWAPQINALSRSYRVVAPDARGHGASSTPTGPFRHTDDLATLLQHLKIEGATLVGVSMGAGTAVDTAVEYPGLVGALVISGAGTSAPDFRDPWLLGVLGDMACAQDSGTSGTWIEAFLRLVPGPHRRVDQVDPRVVGLVREMVVDTLTAHVPAGAPVAPGAVHDVQTRARQLTVPTLAVVGALDAQDHVRFASELVDALPAGRRHVVDGAAHYPNLERPEDFTAALQEFLVQTERPDPS